MKKTNKQGVSLIVLVITIIVMIILAGTIILSLDNNGIIGKAQEAVDKTNLAEVQNLAQLAWAEAYLNNVRTDEDLTEAVMEALDKQEITAEDYEGYAIEVTTSGVKFINKEQQEASLNHSGIIPEGGTYIRGIVYAYEENNEDSTNAITYTAGDAFPNDVVSGDKYIYGDYVYVYNHVLSGQLDQGWQSRSTQNGWGVWCSTNVTVPGAVLESINHEPITSMNSTFYCSSITTAPSIPVTVTDIIAMFMGCESLTGEIEINANPTEYDVCFFETTQPIVLTGTSTRLEAIAATSDTGNVTVKE